MDTPEQEALFLPASLTVSELARYLHRWIEGSPHLANIWVFGEVSNLAFPSSGHIYFSLKEGEASIRCVVWRSQAARLRMDLQNGLALEAFGSVSFYERDGTCQLYVSAVRMVGEGRLYQEFLRLKARLEAEGLFAPERKRPIPERPQRIGIVTSATGAALHDMLTTLAARYPLAEVVLAPAAVQGAEAPAQIVAAIRALNRREQPDVILLGRGGGSLEDLWAFNDEQVVRAVVNSPAPVISGVGHETDFTLADFAADLRAPTPTGAAVAASPDIAEWKATLAALGSAAAEYTRARLDGLSHELGLRGERLLRASPLRRVQDASQQTDMLSMRLERDIRQDLRLRRSGLEGLGLRLGSLDPLSVLQRGFAVVSREDNGAIVRSVKQAPPGSSLQVRVADGQFPARVPGEK